MSRILSGKMRLDVQRVELPLIIDLAIESIMPAASAKGLQIHRTIDPSVEPINGDPGRIQQIVWNLLSNAVKFTPLDGRIDVMLARIDSHIEIRVSDTGEGISSDFLPYIFDRFRQADSSKTRPHGGLGIGLALVKQLVELHGGRVHATSGGKGQGTTFAVELPVAIPSQVRDHSPSNPTTAPDQLNQETTLLGRIRVLVVDDEPDSLALVRRVLEENEAIVTTAASAEEALNILPSQTFDVIVSDIGMPVQDGYAFIAEARRRGIQTPALALTAFARPEDRAQSLLNGYQEHLSKPVQMGELLATVATLAQKGVSLIQDDYRVHVRRSPGR
jgi:CheY-like chemotaxis protein